MMPIKKPAPIEGSGGLDDTQPTALHGVQYNAYKDRISELQRQLAVLETDKHLQECELNGAIWALTQCHLDMPSKWSRHIVEKIYPAQIPENVRIRLRHGLSPMAGGFPRVAA